MQCNFQVAEVLATVIKKEKEDETENKSEYRCLSQLCSRQTLSIRAPMVLLVGVFFVVSSDSCGTLWPGTTCSATVCVFFRRSLVGLVTRPAY